MTRMIRRVVVSMVASFEKNRTEHESLGPHCRMLSALLASHLVPLLAEIFLDLVTFLDASSFIATKAARAAA
jgi:hypothetical protein